jgi:hypothetical protein
MLRHRTTVKQLLFLVVALALLLMPWRNSFDRHAPYDIPPEPPPPTEPKSSSGRMALVPTDRNNRRCPGTGLAAVDLAGNCRAVPNATMGALEAVEK